MLASPGPDCHEEALDAEPEPVQHGDEALYADLGLVHHGDALDADPRPVQHRDDVYMQIWVSLIMDMLWNQILGLYSMEMLWTQILGL